MIQSRFCLNAKIYNMLIKNFCAVTLQNVEGGEYLCNNMYVNMNNIWSDQILLVCRFFSPFSHYCQSIHVDLLKNNQVQSEAGKKRERKGLPGSTASQLTQEKKSPVRPPETRASEAIRGSALSALMEHGQFKTTTDRLPLPSEFCFSKWKQFNVVVLLALP